jgi:hypothetical protein
LAEIYLEIDPYETTLYLLRYINLLPATADLLARSEGAEGRHLFSFPNVSIPTVSAEGGRQLTTKQLTIKR